MWLCGKKLLSSWGGPKTTHWAKFPICWRIEAYTPTGLKGALMVKKFGIRIVVTKDLNSEEPETSVTP